MEQEREREKRALIFRVLLSLACLVEEACILICLILFLVCFSEQSNRHMRMHLRIFPHVPCILTPLVAIVYSRAFRYVRARGLCVRARRERVEFPVSAS